MYVTYYKILKSFRSEYKIFTIYLYANVALSKFACGSDARGNVRITHDRNLSKRSRYITSGRCFLEQSRNPAITSTINRSYHGDTPSCSTDPS